MKKLRIMQITHDLAIGGLQQVVVNICRTIDRERFDVSVLCLRALGGFVPEVEKLGIEVILLPQKKNGVDYLSFLKVAKILRETKIDAIHTHNTQPLIDGTLGALLAGVRTVIHTDHARHYPDKRRYLFAEWVMSHFVRKMVGVSAATVADLRKYEKIASRKLLTIPNGIDDARLVTTIDKQKKKTELGIVRTGPVIGLGVRLAEQKGITYLLQAMPRIIRRRPDITLVIAGEGELEQTLKDEAISLEIEKNVLFVGPRYDMPEVLQLFDLYVLPSLWEGLPMVLLEAMAVGCPIVATDVGGNSTAVIHGENGSLVESKNPEALEQEIVRLLEDDALRNRYGQRGRELFLRRFTARNMTAQYEKLYLGDAVLQEPMYGQPETSRRQ
jgi:glycosyltransferase involved in cell wall biosynthesis